MGFSLDIFQVVPYQIHDFEMKVGDLFFLVDLKISLGIWNQIRSEIKSEGQHLNLRLHTQGYLLEMRIGMIHPHQVGFWQLTSHRLQNATRLRNRRSSEQSLQFFSPIKQIN